MAGEEHVGYARAIDALCRDVSARTRYPRRDAMITLQADFTDQPEHLPELIKRFEGGADLVVAERTVAPTTPQPMSSLPLDSPTWAVRAVACAVSRASPIRSARSVSIEFRSFAIS